MFCGNDENYSAAHNQVVDSMDIVTLIVASLVFSLFVAILLQCILSNRGLPPGPYGLPFFGFSPFIGQNFARQLMDMKSKYGNVICVKLGTKPIVILNDWDAVKEGFGRQGDIFSGRTRNFVNKLFSNDYTDIVFNDGPLWKEQKRFSIQVLRDLGFGRSASEDVIMTEVDKLTEYLNSRDGQPVEVTTLFFITITNVVFGITAGKRYEITDEEIISLHEFLMQISVPKYALINFLPFLRFLFKGQMSGQGYEDGINKIRSFLAKIIDEHEKNFQENNKRDFIDYYLAEIERRKQDGIEQFPFTKRNLEGVVFDFFLAGVETTENMMIWAILYLLINNDVQKKLQAELDKVIPRDSFLSINSKALTPYAQAILFEVHRHASIAALTAQHRTMADTTIFGKKVKKDTCVFFNIYSVHYDKQYWGDPEVFRPERFLDESGNLKKTERLLPFGGGPRFCLGESLATMELYMFLTCLMRRFSFDPIPDQPLATTERRRGNATTKAKPFSVIVKRRI